MTLKHFLLPSFICNLHCPTDSAPFIPPKKKKKTIWDIPIKQGISLTKAKKKAVIVDNNKSLFHRKKKIFKKLKEKKRNKIDHIFCPIESPF